jgi:hypothetical protein
MKLCVANLARTDLTPRPDTALLAVKPAHVAEGSVVDVALFETDEEDVPTTVYSPKRTRTRGRAATVTV